VGSTLSGDPTACAAAGGHNAVALGTVMGGKLGWGPAVRGCEGGQGVQGLWVGLGQWQGQEGC